MGKRAVEIPPKEQLLANYTTINETAKFFNVSWPTLKKWFEFYGIETKDHKTASLIANSKNKGCVKKIESHKILSDKDWLYEQWITKKLSLKSIAKMCSCSETIVNEYLIKFNIKNIKKQQSYQNKQIAIEQYLSGLKMEDCNASSASLSRWLKENNIETRKPNSYSREFTKISKQHQEIIDFIRSLGVTDININDRTTCGTECDILLPNYKIAIEVNGILYHSELYGKDRFYHWNKTKMCSERGYALFHIFEDQWKYKKEICKSMIRSKLGLIINKIHARKCIIKTVNSQDRILFLEKNHIQGKCNSTIAYGLYYGDKLVSVMSFRTPRFTKKFQWELVRFATELDTTVVGGFQKLLSRFIIKHSGSLVSYSDNTYSTGNVYSKSGFVLDGENKPSYYYCNLNKTIRIPRTQFTKKQLSNRGIDVNHCTEKDIMKMLGFTRIWDCGTKRWVLDR